MRALALLLAAAAVSVPTKDRQIGHVTGATGAYAGDHGQVMVTLAPLASNSRTRRLTVRLTGKACGASRRCLDMSGRLTGTITLRPQIVPDTGGVFDLALGGRVTPLGSVSLHGTVHGTGFVTHGNIMSTFTLHGRRGSVTITAQSGTVPGFTAP
jgi:hypothetical protein